MFCSPSPHQSALSVAFSPLSFVLFLLLLHFLSLSSFTKCKPPLPLSLSPILFRLAPFTPLEPLPLFPSFPATYHPLPLYPSPLKILLFSLPKQSCLEKDRILVLYSKLNSPQHVLRPLSRTAVQAAACGLTDFRSVCFKGVHTRSMSRTWSRHTATASIHL